MGHLVTSHVNCFKFCRPSGPFFVAVARLPPGWSAALRGLSGRSHSCHHSTITCKVRQRTAVTSLTPFRHEWKGLLRCKKMVLVVVLFKKHLPQNATKFWPEVSRWLPEFCLSWETMTTVFSQFFKNSSSQVTAWTSKWLVGSSKSNRSGCTSETSIVRSGKFYKLYDIVPKMFK